MNKRGSADKIKLSSFDDLFGTQEAGTGTEQVQEIPLCELHEFRGHPFKVLDDEKMQETVESIKNYGVLMPGIARPRAEGGYEIIAGHRRRHGCELAGLSTMPIFVRDYTDDEATIIMVDTNIQREDILPSEKARAYSMKYTTHIMVYCNRGKIPRCNTPFLMLFFTEMFDSVPACIQRNVSSPESGQDTGLCSPVFC